VKAPQVGDSDRSFTECENGKPTQHQWRAARQTSGLEPAEVHGSSRGRILLDHQLLTSGEAEHGAELAGLYVDDVREVDQI
jgi:hypothetical protein